MIGNGAFKFYKRNVWIRIVLLIALSWILFLGLSLARLPIIWSLVIFCGGLVAARSLIRGLKSFSKGIDGEVNVSKELKKLPEGFTFFNDVVLGSKGNVDIVVVGPTGVWILEVKNQVKYNDKFIYQADAEASDVRYFIYEKLTKFIRVMPVVVMAHKFTKLRFGFKPQRGVYVIRSDWLNRLLTENIVQNLDPQTQAEISALFSGYNYHLRNYTPGDV